MDRYNHIIDGKIPERNSERSEQMEPVAEMAQRWQNDGFSRWCWVLLY